MDFNFYIQVVLVLVTFVAVIGCVYYHDRADRAEHTASLLRRQNNQLLRETGRQPDVPDVDC